MRKPTLLVLLLGLAAGNAAAQNREVSLPLEMLLNREGKIEIPAELNAVVETRGWTMNLNADGSPAFTRAAKPFHHRQLQQQTAASANRQLLSDPDDQHWDDQFSLRGTNGDVFVLKAHMGTVYIGGLFTTVGKTVARNIAKWDGTSWSSLGTGAENGVNADVQAIEIDGNDVYIAGSFSKAGTVTANKVARWDGTSWHSLGTGLQNGVDGFYVTCLALKQPGQLFVGGSIQAAGGAQARNLAFWDGSSWSEVGGGTNYTVWSMAYIDDKLFVGGGFDSAGTAPLEGLGYYANGSWHSMGGVNDWVMNIKPGAMDEVLITGFFDTVAGQPMNHVARYSISNQTWQPLGSGTAGDNGTNGPVRDIFHNFGTYYLAGDFTMAGTTPANNVAIYNFGGFQAIGQGVDNVVRGIGRDADGKLVLGGSFMTAGDSLSYGVARADFDAFDLSIPPIWDAITPGVHNGADGGISKAIVANGELYVCGSFSWLGTEEFSNVAKWNGTSWEPLGAGIGGFVNDLVWHNGELYAGGYFAIQQGSQYSPLIGRFDGTEWQLVGQGVGGSVASQVIALESDGANLYVAGFELSEAANPNGSVINISNIARWDGSEWHAMGQGIEMGQGIVRDLKWHQGDLYVAGFFTQAGGQPVSSIAKWDGQDWTSVGSGINGMVHALDGDANYLYAGGEFTQAGNAPAKSLARWDGTTWTEVGGGVDLSNASPFNSPYVSALMVRGDGIYVGGYFDQVGAAVQANGVAYWSNLGWQKLGSGLGDGRATSFAEHQNKLFTTGSFYIAGQKGASSISSYASIVTGVEEDAQTLSGIQLYPNPASGVVKIVVPGSKTVQAIITDVTGRLVQQLSLPAGEQQLNIAALPSGMYQVRLHLRDAVAVEKLVVLK